MNGIIGYSLRSDSKNGSIVLNMTGHLGSEASICTNLYWDVIDPTRHLAIGMNALLRRKKRIDEKISFEGRYGDELFYIRASSNTPSLNAVAAGTYGYHGDERYRLLITTATQRFYLFTIVI